MCQALLLAEIGLAGDLEVGAGEGEGGLGTGTSNRSKTVIVVEIAAGCWSPCEATLRKARRMNSPRSQQVYAERDTL